MARIEIIERILSANDRIALQVRRALDERGMFALDLMGSPGAGKTSLILRTVEALAGQLRIAVIEGDIASTLDADRVAAAGVPVVQINTGGTCHLDAPMIQEALDRLDTEGADLLLIENVGNLICPNEFAVGAHRRVLIASVPEGDDKPYKYPAMFQDSDAVVLNKTDLLPYLEFDMAAYQELVTGLNPDVALFEVSCKSGVGIRAWTDWLVAEACRPNELGREPGGR